MLDVPCGKCGVPGWCGYSGFGGQHLCGDCIREERRLEEVKRTFCSCENPTVKHWQTANGQNGGIDYTRASFHGCPCGDVRDHYHARCAGCNKLIEGGK
jgi:hypothetical protein